MILLVSLCVTETRAEQKRPKKSWATTQAVAPLVERFFDDAAKKRGLSDKEREAYRARGGKLITDYLANKENTWGPVLGEILSEAKDQKGWWPKPKVVGMIVDRAVDTAGRIYEFDDRQRGVFGRWMKERMPQMLEKQRKNLEPVMTDVLLQYASGKPPDPAKIQEWSKKLLPLTNEFKEVYSEGYRKMLPHLAPEQRSRWGKDYFRVSLGYTMVQAKLRSYSKGGFDPKEWSKTPANPNLGPLQYAKIAEQLGMDTSTPPHIENPIIGAMSTERIGPDERLGPDRAGQVGKDADGSGGRYVSLDRWQAQTRQFIKDYDLDEGQKTAAMAVLKEVRQRARAYHKTHRKDIDRLRRSARKAKGQARTRISAELGELERPLHQLFEEFRSRLDEILDETQRP